MGAWTPDAGVDTRIVRDGPAHALLEATDEAFVHEAFVHEALVHEASVHEASVVVIGAHRRTGRPGPHHGPVAHTPLHGSHCPVVAVPHGDHRQV